MNRRAFLTRLLKPGSVPEKRGKLALASGLEPYVPSQTAPWDLVRAGHLLRRATFMPRWQDIDQILKLSPGEAVDLLLNTSNTPAQPSCADSETESLEGLDQQSRQAIIAKWSQDTTILRLWYGEVMRDAPVSIVEKMTLFWSGHFATEFAVDDEYVVAPLLYRQNKLFRESGLLNFKDLVTSVTMDGAMLVYLGGNLNSVGKPNENYARELLELFTTGLGWYTEGDIKNAARVLTGWRVARFSDGQFPNGMFNLYFEPPFHDTGAKVFFGTSFPAMDAATNTDHFVRLEVRKLIDTIFEKRPQAVAKFISRKIYQFFVYSNPTSSDENVIQEMADLFIQSNFEIRPVISALLKSAHFFDNGNIGCQIKTPAEFMVGVGRQLNPEVELAGNMSKIGQTLFDPPNVSGWPGHHEWITTSTFPVRSEIVSAAIAGLDEATAMDFIKQFPDHTDVEKFVRNAAQLLLPRKLSQRRVDALVEKLLEGQPSYEWTNMVLTSASSATRNLKGMLTSVVELPDFQLS